MQTSYWTPFSTTVVLESQLELGAGLEGVLVMEGALGVNEEVDEPAAPAAVLIASAMMRSPRVLPGRLAAALGGSEVGVEMVEEVGVEIAEEIRDEIAEEVGEAADDEEDAD